MSLIPSEVIVNGVHYTIKKKIGKGLYGIVFLAESGDKEYAIKMVKVVESEEVGWGIRVKGKKVNDTEFGSLTLDQFLAEVETAKQIENCPSMIRYFGHSPYKDVENTFIVMEYVEGYELYQFLNCQRESKYHATPEQITTMAKHLLRGLACIHKLGIAHRDIHPGNIMFNKTQMKIVDYGLLCHAKKGMPECGEEEFIRDCGMLAFTLLEIMLTSVSHNSEVLEYYFNDDEAKLDQKNLCMKLYKRYRLVFKDKKHEINKIILALNVLAGFDDNPVESADELSSWGLERFESIGTKDVDLY